MNRFHKISIRIFILLFFLRIWFPDLIFCQDTSNGIIWYPAIQLSDDTISSVSPQITSSGDDTVHITWKSFGTDKMKLPYAKIVSGEIVERKDLLRDDLLFSSGVTSPVITSQNGKVFLFFVRPDDRRIYLVKSYDGGTTWWPFYPINTEDAWSVSSPTILGSTMAVLYASSSGELKLMRSFDGWSFTSTNEKLGYRGEIVLTKNNLHLIQSKYLDGNIPEINYRRSSDMGDSWEIDTMLSEIDGRHSDYPVITGFTTDCGTELSVAWSEAHDWGVWHGCITIQRSGLKNGKLWLPAEIQTENSSAYERTVGMNKNVKIITFDEQLVMFGETHSFIRSTNNSFNNYSPKYDLGPISIENIAVSSKAVYIVWGEYDYATSTNKIFCKRGEFVQSNANFSLSTSSLKMDTMEIDRVDKDSVIVMNTGSDTMIVGTAISDNDNFYVIPEDTTIAPFSQASFKVFFKPKSYGNHEGRIIFYHNGQSAAGGTPDCFDVSGTGIWRIDTIKYQPDKWNLVSIPIKPSQHQTLPSLFSYEGSYIQRDTLLFGKGYWAKPESSCIYTGAPVYNDSFVVKPGWNIIGSVALDVPVVDIITQPDSILVSPFFRFDGIRYLAADTIKPGSGYWIKIREDGKVILK
jgi:hypothetical protein